MSQSSHFPFTNLLKYECEGYSLKWCCILIYMLLLFYHIRAGFPGVTNGKNKKPSNARNSRDEALIPGVGRSPEIGNGNLLQFSCLKHSMNRGAWQATVHGVAKSCTWRAVINLLKLSLSFNFFSCISKIFIKWHCRALLYAGDMVMRKTDMIPAFTDWMTFGGSFGLCSIGR